MREPDGWIVSCPGCRRPYIYDAEWEAPDRSCPECGDPEVEVTPFLRWEPDDREGLASEEEIEALEQLQDEGFWSDALHEARTHDPSVGIYRIHPEDDEKLAEYLAEVVTSTLEVEG